MLCADPRRVRHILHRALERNGCSVEWLATGWFSVPFCGTHGRRADSWCAGCCAEVFRDGGLPTVVSSDGLACSDDIGTYFVSRSARAMDC